MFLCFDTETTGVTGKPHLVQLAFILSEDDGTLRGSANFIIKPEGYEIPNEAASIHGITTEIALRCGVPLSVAVSAFNNSALLCTGGKLVAHNLAFDVRIMRAAYERGGWPSRIDNLEPFCTMEAVKNEVRMPPTPKMIKAGVPGFKSPKLSEAYQFIFNKPLENAHDALYDVNACKELYLWVQKKRAERTADPTCRTDRDERGLMRSRDVLVGPIIDVLRDEKKTAVLPKDWFANGLGRIP